MSHLPSTALSLESQTGRLLHGVGRSNSVNSAKAPGHILFRVSWAILLAVSLGLAPRSASGQKGGSPDIPAPINDSFYDSNMAHRFGTGEATTAEPIDVATGAFSLRQPLASIPGRVPMSVSWIFGSQDASNGPLGIGTCLSTDYFVTAAVGSAGNYDLVAPGNRHYRFVLSTGTTYINSTDPEVLGATLTMNAPGTNFGGTLRYKSGAKFFFSTTGALYQMQDRLGNALNIARGTGGFTTQISQPSGRAINFTYNGSNKLSTVSIPGSPSWTFTYDVNGRLSQVTDPRTPLCQYDLRQPIVS